MAARKSNKSNLPMASPHAAAFPAELADELAGYARDVGATADEITGGGWPFISIRGGAFTLKQQQLDNPLRAIIVGVAHDNAYYKRAFDPDDNQGPDCTAVGLHKEKLAPPENWPSREADNCMTCWANAWGSSPRGGRGKACGNRVRLTIVPFYKGVDLAKVEGARLRIPTTSGPQFEIFKNEIKALNEGSVPVFAYVTEIGVEPDPKNTLKMTFKLLAALPRELMGDVKRRIVEAQTPLLQVNDPSSDAPPIPKRKKGTKKAPGRGR